MPRIVLFDADVISHFIANEMLSFLPVICHPHKMVILDEVYREAIMLPGRRSIITNFLRDNEMTIAHLPEILEINMEFALIKRNFPLIGDGERALMANARYNGDIIASSNFRDIANYCTENHIDFLGTLDLLAIAVKKRIMSVAQCNRFMNVAITENHAKFPKDIIRISDYTCTKLQLLD